MSAAAALLLAGCAGGDVAGDGSPASSAQGTISVAGEPTPGQITFSDFGKGHTVSPPPADLIIDVSKLGG